MMFLSFSLMLLPQPPSRKALQSKLSPRALLRQSRNPRNRRKCPPKSQKWRNRSRNPKPSILPLNCSTESWIEWTVETSLPTRTADLQRRSIILPSEERSPLNSAAVRRALAERFENRKFRNLTSPPKSCKRLLTYVLAFYYFICWFVLVAWGGSAKATGNGGNRT